jgi:hypothetical protein
MLTRTDLWILVLAIIATGVIVTVWALPGYFADREGWAEDVRPELPVDDVRRALDHFRARREASRG